MKISALNYQTKSVLNKNKKNEIQYSSVSSSLNRGFGYPKGFIPYFGARLFRTPENFYEQEFNKKGMPLTLSKYLHSNYEVNSKKPPMQLNQEAFTDLLLCESIDDVKEMFPDEPLFQNLKTLQTIRPKQGYLRDLRMVDTKNNEVLSNGEDLTVYLLKKVYLEGKDIEEINADFQKDMKPELTVANATKDGSYFLHSTLHSLGIYLPDKSYWASLQATRLDKEYIPSTWTLTKPRKKPVYTKPRVVKKLELSPEERQRRRDMMINRWIEMSPAQRQAQLSKMKEGQQNSTFYQYIVPIMLIANDRAHFQDKMYQFFRENKASLNTDAPDDMDDMTPKQAKAMKLFWAQNNRLRRSYFYYINSTLKEFEQAQEQGPEALDELINKAAQIRDRNAEKRLRRKLSNPEVVRAELKDIMLSQIDPFPEQYVEKYVKFIMNHKRFNDEIIPLKVRHMFANEEKRPLIIKQSQSIMDELFKEFNSKNKRDSISASIALAFVVRPFLQGVARSFKDHGKPEIAELILTDSNEMLTGGPSCVLGMLNKYDSTTLKDKVKQYKDTINKVMKIYTRGFDGEETRRLVKNVMEYMSYINTIGNYKFLNNQKIRQRCSDKLPRVLRDLERNKDERRIFAEFLRDYEGLFRYTENLVISSSKGLDSKKLQEDKNLRYYVYESVIDDYLIRKEK